MSENEAPRCDRPMLLILFGGTGDLAHRLVLPALFRLAKENLLPEKYLIVGNGRGDVSHEDFQGRVKESLEEFGPKPDDGPWEQFGSSLRFAGGGFEASDPGSLLDVIAQAEKELGEDYQLIHYLAVPPSAFVKLTEGLGEHDLAKDARVVYEKPFGTSKESFQELDKAAHEVFEEEQIYRIDHFLGKEATQDIHVLRFANALFCNSWDSDHIESVQIDVPETLDVGMRVDFYEHTGAILDMIVTHLFQVAAEVAMEPPAKLDANSLAEARSQVIGAFRPLSWEETVIGQYEGYAETEGVEKGSKTETFVALKLWIDNPRWQGVPFLLRTGKCLAESHQRVSVVLKDSCSQIEGLPQLGNVLSFELSGDGAIVLRLITKRPGPTLEFGAADAELPLGKAYHTTSLPAYSRLIHDVTVGDRSLFTRPDGLEHVWEVASPILSGGPTPVIYPTGSWGPDEADALAQPSGWVLSSGLTD